MISRMLCWMIPVRVTAAYALALGVVAVVLLALGPDAHDAAVSQMSTNLSNLAHGQVGTLVGSAFVTDGGDVYLWLPGLVCLLASAELLWRAKGLVLAFGVGHIGATLLVALGLAMAITAGWLPTSIEFASDVGISYGAAGVVGALTAALPPTWRPAWVGWWLGVGLLIAAASDGDFTAYGHLLALLLGMMVSRRFHATPQWTVTRVALFAVGIGFWYSLLVGSSLAAPIAGLAGVAIGYGWRSVRSGTVDAARAELVLQ